MFPVTPVVVTVVEVPSANVLTLPVTVVVPLVAVPATPFGHVTINVPSLVMCMVKEAEIAGFVQLAPPLTVG